MSEVSSWSATDASNNLTPPDGWPEGMQQSGVNNVGRMMMGAIRRWYDTIVSGSLVLPYLSSNGGTVTGNISVTGSVAATNVTATSTLAAHDLTVVGGINTTAMTAADITVTGGINTGAIDVSGPLTADDATVTGGINTSAIAVSGDLTAGTVTTGYLHSSGASDLNGSCNVGGNLDVTGLLTTHDLHTDLQTVNTTLIVNGTTSVNALTAASVTSPYIHSTGNLDVNGTLNAIGTLNANAIGANGITVFGTLNANAIGSANEVTATNYQLSGHGFATRGSDGAGAFNAIYDAQGGVAAAFYGTNGSYYRCDNAHAFTNRAATVNIVRFQVSDGVCQNASGSWSTLSDEVLKEDVQPYNAGLQALLALEPVSFRYTEDAPFGAGQKHYGLIAQEVEGVLPEMVGRFDGTDYRTLTPGHLVFVLLNAVKELEARLAQLEGR